jgi:beta-glucosidase-like glycosyl hydrolase
VVLQCGALDNPNYEAYIRKNFSNNTNQRAALALNAGCDTGCDNALNDFTVLGLQAGTVTMDTVDEALHRVYRYVAKLGLMDGPLPKVFERFGPQTIDTPGKCVGTDD